MLVAVVLMERPNVHIVHSGFIVELVNLCGHNGEVSRCCGGVQWFYESLNTVVSNPGVGIHPRMLGGDYDTAGEEYHAFEALTTGSSVCSTGSRWFGDC